jgi:hypothetical protein
VSQSTGEADELLAAFGEFVREPLGLLGGQSLLRYAVRRLRLELNQLANCHYLIDG